MIERFLLALPTVLLSAVLCASALLALTRSPAPSPRGMALLFGGFLLLTTAMALATTGIVEAPALTVVAALLATAGAITTVHHHIAPAGGA